MNSAKRSLSPTVREQLLKFQHTEATEAAIYRAVAARLKPGHNREVLERLADEETKHERIWQRYTGTEVQPNQHQVRWYTFLARTLGFTFSARLMENNERSAQQGYALLLEEVPEAEKVLADEERHEAALLDLLDEEALRYAGSVVLGLNDALVELTGALAGLTFAFQDTRVIALSGLITGIAASLSMAASEYLSTSTEADEKNPGLAALYTGIAYVITVALLILPYLLGLPKFVALGIMLVTAVIIIALFTAYYSVAMGINFRKRFMLMAAVSLGVAALSFGIGYLVRILLGVDI
ncbi:MAG: rubrerythrin family protein [Chloroflexi bacterium]|nr:rubrerythrin family protein [Chloroflexota bacterium]